MSAKARQQESAADSRSTSTSSSILGIQTDSVSSKIGEDVKQMISKVIGLIRLSDKLEQGSSSGNEFEPNASSASSSEPDEFRNVRCDIEYLDEIVAKVISVLRCSTRHYDYLRLYEGQLTTYLQDALRRYEDKRLVECIEDVLIEISDILYNELTFYTIMNESRGSGQQKKEPTAEFQQVTLQDRLKYKRNESTVNHCGSSSTTSSRSSSSDTSSDTETKQPVTFHIGPPVSQLHSITADNCDNQFDAHRHKGIELLKKLNTILIEKVDKLTNFETPVNSGLVSGVAESKFDDLNKLDCNDVDAERRASEVTTTSSSIGIKAMQYLKNLDSNEQRSNVASSCGDREELDIEVGGSERSSEAASSYESDGSAPRKVATRSQGTTTTAASESGLPYKVVDVDDLDEDGSQTVVAAVASTSQDSESGDGGVTLAAGLNVDILDKIIMDSISDDLVGDDTQLPVVVIPVQEDVIGGEKEAQQTVNPVAESQIDQQEVASSELMAVSDEATVLPKNNRTSDSSTSDHFVIIKDDATAIMSNGTSSSSSSAGSNSSSEMEVIDMKKEEAVLSDQSGQV
jgi:hypothetical protein